MKKAVIICILSLSLCLSQAAPPADAHPASEAPVTNDAKAKESTLKTEIKIVPTEITKTEKTPAEATVKPETKPDTKPEEKKPAETEKPVEKPEEKKPAEKAPESKPEDNKTEKTEKQTEAAPAKTPEKPAEPEKAKAETKPETKPDSKEVTQKPTVKPTETPTVTEKPPQTARGFDGPSFIGGIILALGLLAIGFMGFKYYKNQTERNYHTL